MSRLQIAIDNTPDVRGEGKVGKAAIKNEYRSKIVVADPRKLTYSLDIDDAVKDLYTNANRWDYALEYNDEVFFIEFHPANTSEIKTMLEKLSWLKQWLNEHAPQIDALKSKSSTPYYWIATQGVHIASTSSHYRKLATQKLLPQSQWRM